MAAAEELRAVIVGSGGAGKSCLLMRFMRNIFPEEYDPTIEDSYRTQMEVDGTACLLDVLDTAGQEEYSALRDLYMSLGEGFVICYDLTSRRSYDEIEAFHDQILRVKSARYAPVVLVATKCDLAEEGAREVLEREGRDVARGWGVPFFETSAKTGECVPPVFDALVRTMRTHAAAQAARGGRGAAAVARGDPVKHQDSVWACVVVGGRFVVSASRDTTARVWCLRTGALLGVLRGHMRRLYDVCVVQEGNAPGGDLSRTVLVTAADDGDCRVWLAEPATCVAVLRHSNAEAAAEGEAAPSARGVTAVVYDADAGQIHAGGLDGRVCTWDVAREWLLPHARGSDESLMAPTVVAPLAERRCASAVNCLALVHGPPAASAAGRVVRRAGVAAGCSDGSAYVFATGPAPPGAEAATDGEDIGSMGAAPHWTSVLDRMCFPNAEESADAAGPATATTLAAGLSAGLAALGTAFLAPPPPPPPPAPPPALAPAPAPPALTETASSGDGTGTFTVTMTDESTSHAPGSGGGTWLAGFWRAARTRTRTLPEQQRLVGHTQSVYHVAWGDTAATPHTLFTAAADATARAWDVTARRCRCTFRGHTDWVNAIVFCAGTPDTLYTGSRDHTVRAWAPLTGECLNVFVGHKDSVRTIAVSGAMLVSAGKEASAFLWNRSTGELLWQFEGQHDRRNAFINAVVIAAAAPDRARACCGSSAAPAAGRDVLVTAGTDRLLCTYDIDRRQLRRVLTDRVEAARMEAAPRWRVRAGALLMLIDFLQLVAFAFVSPAVVWHPANPGLGLAPVFQLSLPFASPAAFAAAYAAAAVLAVLFAAGFVAAQWLWNRPGAAWRAVWHTDRVLARLVSGVLFVPVARLLLAVYDCPGPTCLLGLQIASPVLLLPMIALALRLAGVDGDVSRRSTAFYHLWTWRYDKPDTRRAHLLSRRSTDAERWLKALQLLLVVVTQFVPNGVAVVCLLAAAAAAALALSWWSPPYHARGVSRLRLALLGTVAWAYAAGGIALARPGGIAPTIAQYAAMPVVFAAVWAAAGPRLASVAASDAAAHAASSGGAVHWGAQARRRQREEAFSAAAAIASAADHRARGSVAHANDGGGAGADGDGGDGDDTVEGGVGVALHAAGSGAGAAVEDARRAAGARARLATARRLLDLERAELQALRAGGGGDDATAAWMAAQREQTVERLQRTMDDLERELQRSGGHST